DLEQGVFLVDQDGHSFFAYRLVQGDHVQVGLVACVSASEYRDGIIKRHENTRAHKQHDRIEHIKAVGAHTGPVFLAYRARPEIDALVAGALAEQPPLYDFTALDGVRHTVWRIAADERAQALQQAFVSVDALYIADGHHRAAAAVALDELAGATEAEAGASAGVAAAPAATAAALAAATAAAPREADHFLAILFPSNQLQIRDYNRVVSELNGLSVEEFLRRVAERFTVEPVAVCDARVAASGVAATGARAAVPDVAATGARAAATDVCAQPTATVVAKGAPSTPARPERRGTYGMYVDGRWYQLTLDEASRPLDPVQSLDVAILHERLLAPVLGITDPSQDDRIAYVGGVRGLRELAQRVDAQGGVAFALHPCSLDELFAVADADRLMPPKSTWFEPKPRSGLFIHRL
ncbi:MAG: DUF1015 family protein, partial [Coriobacteriales bacterium]|nr:DUF1015 family protein [Coriobacteriales bacterium]